MLPTAAAAPGPMALNRTLPTTTFQQQQQHCWKGNVSSLQYHNYHSTSISLSFTTEEANTSTTKTTRAEQIEEITKANLTLHSTDDSPYQQLKQSLEEAYTNHETLLSSSSSKNDEEAIAKSHMDVGKIHYKLGQLLLSQDQYESALSLLLSFSQKNDHKDVASIMHTLGSIHAQLGDVEEAKKWCKGSLDMKQRLYLDADDDNKYHPEIGRGLNGLAMCLIQQHAGGDNEVEKEEEEEWEKEAIELFQKALQNFIEYEPSDEDSTSTSSSQNKEKDLDTEEDHDDNHYNPNHPANHIDVSHINMNLALLHRQMEQYNDALHYYRESLRIQQLHSKDDESIVKLYIDMGDCLLKMEEYSDAKISYDDALRIHLEVKEQKIKEKQQQSIKSDKDAEERAEDDDSNEADKKYVSLLDMDDDEEEVEKRMEQEKKRRQQELEKLQQSTSVEGVIRHNLGRIYAHEGNYDKALSEYKQSLAIKKHIGGSSHIEVGQTLNCMGAVHGAIGDLYRAMSCFKEALFIFRLHSHAADEADDLDIVYAKRNIEMVQASLDLQRMDDGGDRLG